LARHLSYDPEGTNSADYCQAGERSADNAKSLLSLLERTGRQLDDRGAEE
jgi:hypothetical protein